MPPDRPNLLLICTDTQRCDTLGAYGGRVGNTPHLDRLADEGVVFHQAHTASPVCGPARASLITGLYPPCHGAIENGFDPHPGLTTLPDRLRDAGYRCLMAGKTHFGPIPDAFDRVSEGPPVDQTGGYPQRDAEVVTEALDWLAEAPDDRPFFLFLSLHMPHEPFQPDDDALARVEIDRLPPLNHEPGDLDRLPDYLRHDLGIPHDRDLLDRTYFPDGRPDHAEIDADRRRYQALVGMIDDQVGRVRAALDRLGLADDTLIAFTSDHGTAGYDRGFKDKHHFHDESWRVPLIVHHPATLAPADRHDLISWVDLTATLLGVAGGDASECQGYDLAEALRDPEMPWPRHALPATVFHTLALVTDRWKLEYDALRATGRLFDRRADPLERRDLWPDAPPARDRLRHALLAWHAALHSPQRSAQRHGRGGPVADAALATERALTAQHADRLLDRLVGATIGGPPGREGQTIAGIESDVLASSGEAVTG
jgi:arylsulfatase A-like enzyme